MLLNAGVFNSLTCKCASRHSGVQFFDIKPPKSGPYPSVFPHFDLQICFAPQRRAIFEHRNFQNGSYTLSFLTFWLSNVLRATGACHFWTSELPKWLRECTHEHPSVWPISAVHRTIGSSDQDHRIRGSSDHRISGPADHRIIGSSDQRTSGPSDHRTVGSADHRIIGPSDHRISGSADHRISGSSDHRTSGSSDHRTIGPADHRIIGPSDQRMIGSSDHRAMDRRTMRPITIFTLPPDHRIIGPSRIVGPSDQRIIGPADHIIWSSDHQMHIWWSSDQDLYGPLKWSDINGRVDVWSGDGCVFFRFPVLQLFTLPSCQASKLHSMIISSSASLILGLCKLCFCVRASWQHFGILTWDLYVRPRRKNSASHATRFWVDGWPV